MKKESNLKYVLVFFVVFLVTGCTSLQESLKTQTQREYFIPTKDSFNEAVRYVDSDTEKAVDYFKNSIVKMGGFLKDTEESSRKRESLQKEIQEANSFIAKAYFGIGRWCYYAKGINDKKEISLGERLKLFEQTIEQVQVARKYQTEPKMLEDILETEERAKDEIEVIRKVLELRGRYRDVNKNINEIIRKAKTDKSLGADYIKEFNENKENLRRLRTHDYLEEDIMKVISDVNKLEQELAKGEVIPTEVISSAHFEKANSLYKIGQYLDALEEFRLVGEDHPSYKEAREKIKEIEGKKKISEEQYQEGRELYDKGEIEKASEKLKSVEESYLTGREVKNIREVRDVIGGGGDLGTLTHDGIIGRQVMREGSMAIGDVRDYSIIIENFGDLEICVSPGYRVEGEGFQFPPDPKDPNSGIKIFEGDPTRYKRFIREKIESGTPIRLKIVRERGPDNFKFIFKLYPR